MLANKYTEDQDVVTGGGFDRINVADGDRLDTANGGKGRDFCIVAARKRAEAAPRCRFNAARL